MTRPFADLHVAVLMGGLSSEREVSLSSGRMCADALEGQVARVSRVDAGRDLACRARRPAAENQHRRRRERADRQIGRAHV